MNPSKARDFFSAYYEGNLEVGLRQSFEITLRNDATLQADYAAFVETIHQLDALKHEEIPIPIFLSDRIATRLEEAQGKQRFGFPLWTNWIRGLAVAGLAAVAFIGALPLFNGRHDVGMSGAIGGGSNVDQLQFKVDGSKLIVLYQPSSAKTVVVTSANTNKEISRFTLDGQRLESPIENSLSNPAIMKIQVLGDKASALVAIPGQSIPKAKSGEGSVQDLAVALAGHYRIPVVVEAADVTHHVTWSFSSNDPRQTANQALSADGFSVDVRPDGLLEILDR